MLNFILYDLAIESLEAIIYGKEGKNVKFYQGLKLDFKSSVGGEPWCSVTFDQFVLLIQDVVHADVKFNTRENIPGYRTVKQSEGIHLNSSRYPIDPFLIIPCTDMCKGDYESPFYQKADIQIGREFVFWPSQE